mmetsp:Transcript_21239/g.63651  ORF Transcript_21239/g.63651 Transcript_21239/m.63651 type:complete len:280 (-) Transcript_21239:732-1571(-)
MSSDVCCSAFGSSSIIVRYATGLFASPSPAAFTPETRRDRGSGPLGGPTRVKLAMASRSGSCSFSAALAPKRMPLVSATTCSTYACASSFPADSCAAVLDGSAAPPRAAAPHRATPVSSSPDSFSMRFEYATAIAPTTGGTPAPMPAPALPPPSAVDEDARSAARSCCIAGERRSMCAVSARASVAAAAPDNAAAVAPSPPPPPPTPDSTTAAVLSPLLPLLTPDSATPSPFPTLSAPLAAGVGEAAAATPARSHAACAAAIAPSSAACTCALSARCCL